MQPAGEEEAREDGVGDVTGSTATLVWHCFVTIQPGYYGYSCLAVLPDWTICCLFENDGCSKATFLRFSLDWLTDGKDRMPQQ